MRRDNSRRISHRLAKIRLILRGTGILADGGTWLVDGRLLGCSYPRGERAMRALARQGVSLLVNLHERAHEPARLARHSITETHLPVADFTAPSPEQLEHGVAAIREALGAGKRVAVHCGWGLGRTGTLLACYLVSEGASVEEAIAKVREVRPGSVETEGQAAAIEAYAAGVTSDE